MEISIPNPWHQHAWLNYISQHDKPMCSVDWQCALGHVCCGPGARYFWLAGGHQCDFKSQNGP
eukprot:1667283-Karenia_brevis.AAC.1